MKCVMGIDLGTSSTKAAIFGMDGHLMGTGHGEYGMHIPNPGWVQQDPEKWWQAVCLAVREALYKSGVTGENISGIGLSGQMHGMVALDADDHLVCPAIIHLDQRSAEELPELRRLSGNLMYTELLNQPSAGMLISTLYWMKKHQPDIYKRIHYVMLPKDYIRYRLCGEIGTDFSDASATLGFSVKNRCWCTELFDRLGLNADVCAPARESSEVAGTVLAEASEQTGLLAGTRVVYGAGDAMSALTGNGVVEKGIMTCNIGTASQLAVVVDRPVFDPQMRIQTWCHAISGRWVVQSGALNGGSTLSWLKNNILRETRSFADLDVEAGTIPAGAEGLFFAPYLSGERSPFNNPHARGIYFGLDIKHTQAHIIRATMEGVLFNLKECLQIIDDMNAEHSKLIASGGAARGVTWKQIEADILNMPVYTTNTDEEACHGAAILAAVGIGEYSSISEACDATITFSDKVIEPIPENVKIYGEKQSVFHDLYVSAQNLYGRIV